jgi:hypothetical protein
MASSEMFVDDIHSIVFLVATKHCSTIGSYNQPATRCRKPINKENKMIATDKKHHDIKIKIAQDPNGYARHAVVEMPEGGLHVGETVSYSCPEGSFSLRFPDGSLFGVDGEKIVTSPEEILTLVNANKNGKPFECQCSITPADGSPKIEWSQDDPQSGGAHDVQH